MNTTLNDPLYYPRKELANRLVNSLSDGIAHAFTLFAPRRMGKTQFLLNDVIPIAEDKGFKVFYFSFMDRDNETVANRFQMAVARFSAELTTKDKAKSLFASIDRIAFMGASVSRDADKSPIAISDIIDTLAEAKQPILLLLDEAQELARANDTQGLIRSLRTGLDINKDKVKVIFTGSSIAGLQALFNDSKAPFFHFAHDIDFPKLDKGFSDYLADTIQSRINQPIDKDALYQAFEQMNYTPLYLRAVAQDMILNPTLSLEDALNNRLNQLNDTGEYRERWVGFNALDKAVLMQIAKRNTSLYNKTTLEKISTAINNPTTQSQVQASIKRLTKKEIIAKDIHGKWIITEQAFNSWIISSANN